MGRRKKKKESTVLLNDSNMATVKSEEIEINDFEDFNPDDLPISPEAIRIADVWCIDEDIAQAIFDQQFDSELDACMYITEQGEVESADDEDELKQSILNYLVDTGSLNDIRYIFVDGVPKDVQFDVHFIDPVETDILDKEPEDEQPNDSSGPIMIGHPYNPIDPIY